MKRLTKKQFRKILDGIMESVFIFACVMLAILLGIGPYMNPLPYYEIMTASLGAILISLGYEFYTAKADKK